MADRGHPRWPASSGRPAAKEHIMTEQAERTIVTLRPRYEGSNIRTWIGFKQFMYLVEEAIVQWFRDRGAGPRELYHGHGLGLELVDSSVQLPSVLEVDDVVTAEVAPLGPGRFTVRLSVGGTIVCRGKVTVVLVREKEPPAAVPLAGPLSGLLAGPLAGLVVDRLGPAAAAGEDLNDAAFQWTWCARYFYCHYSDRVQHSAYVRALEETVERFLAGRGISVGRLLADRGWIPVVSRASVRVLADAHMEEVVHTTFEVEDVLKRSGYDGVMNCYVRRGSTCVRTATARILHGYAITRGELAGQLAEFDDEVLAALTGADQS
jgi:acyl-CoA thioesterase FadM